MSKVCTFASIFVLYSSPEDWLKSAGDSSRVVILVSPAVFIWAGVFTLTCPLTTVSASISTFTLFPLCLSTTMLLIFELISLTLFPPPWIIKVPSTLTLLSVTSPSTIVFLITRSLSILAFESRIFGLLLLPFRAPSIYDFPLASKVVKLPSLLALTFREEATCFTAFTTALIKPFDEKVAPDIMSTSLDFLSIILCASILAFSSPKYPAVSPWSIRLISVITPPWTVTLTFIFLEVLNPLASPS